MRFLSDLHLNFFTERNSDGTKHLRLKGKELSLRYKRRVGNKNLRDVSNYMKTMPTLISVDLCYNCFGDSGLKVLVDNYLKFPNPLKELNIMCCNITWQGIAYLVDASDTLSLKSLRVNGNKIGSKGGILLASLCEKNIHLEHLDIAESDQTLSSIAYFTEVLQELDGKKTYLRCLDISRLIPVNWYHTYNREHLANSLGLMLHGNTTLIELHLQKCELDGHDVQFLLDGLKDNKTLLFLDIGYNRIADLGIEKISNYLKLRPPLLALNVAGNSITTVGANALHFGLPFSKIRLLDLSNNHIGDAGIVDILNTIKKPYFLRYLYLFGGNTLGAASIKLIDRMLESGVLVEDQIDINLNKIGHDRQIGMYYNPINRYKHNYYHALLTGVPDPIAIKKNKIIEPITRAKIDFLHYPRFPPAIPLPEPPVRTPLPTLIPSKPRQRIASEEETEERSVKLAPGLFDEWSMYRRQSQAQRRQSNRYSDPITVDSVFLRKIGLYEAFRKQALWDHSSDGENSYFPYDYYNDYYDEFLQSTAGEGEGGTVEDKTYTPSDSLI